MTNPTHDRLVTRNPKKGYVALPIQNYEPYIWSINFKLMIHMTLVDNFTKNISIYNAFSLVICLLIEITSSIEDLFVGEPRLQNAIGCFASVNVLDSRARKDFLF